MKGSVHHKRSIIFRIRNKSMTVGDATAETGWDVETIHKLMTPESIQHLEEFGGDVGRIRIRAGKHPEMETRLAKWVNEVRSRILLSEIREHSDFIDIAGEFVLQTHTMRELDDPHHVEGR